MLWCAVVFFLLRAPPSSLGSVGSECYSARLPLVVCYVSVHINVFPCTALLWQTLQAARLNSMPAVRMPSNALFAPGPLQAPARVSVCPVFSRLGPIV